MGTDFYLVLGVSRDADPETIRRAYRSLVKRFHPDAGGAPPERFHEVQKAYETLSDAERRLAYDRERCAQLPGPLRRGAPPAWPVATSGRSPLTPTAPLAPTSSRRSPLLYDLIDEFVGGYVPGFFVGGRQRSPRKDLYVELLLSPAEAARGGLFTLDLPVRQECHLCWGSGWSTGAACPECANAVAHHELRLSVPPRVADQTRVQLPLDTIGLPRVLLNVLVTIES